MLLLMCKHGAAALGVSLPAYVRTCTVRSAPDFAVSFLLQEAQASQQPDTLEPHPYE
jgi:hypothetical protein